MLILAMDINEYIQNLVTGSQLRSIRLLFGYKQKEFCEFLEIGGGEPALSRYENQNTKFLSQKVSIKLFDFLKERYRISKIEKLFTLDESKNVHLADLKKILSNDLIDSLEFISKYAKTLSSRKIHVDLWKDSLSDYKEKDMKILSEEEIKKFVEAGYREELKAIAIKIIQNI